ncbi:DUF3560 domain-containing protein [Nocardiopsis terrae]|uniref:DUF3560 domain-containing protein n=1 Tax=Streptomyces sp. NPDC057554 TaxID=3350538 RepID=UPI00369DDBAA
MDTHTATRIEKMRGYQDAARRRMNAAAQAGNDASARFAGGQPILRGHHSEKSARAARRRSDQALDRYMKEKRTVEYWGRKIAAAERRAAQKADPGVIQRRHERRISALIAKQGQAVDQGLAAVRAGDQDAKQAAADEIMRFQREIEAARADQVKAREELEASGVKVWGKADFTRGDYAFYDGMWWEIKSANKKTVTVGALVGFTAARARVGGRRVYRLDANPYSWTDTIPYTKITGRMSAADMAARLAG